MSSTYYKLYIDQIFTFVKTLVIKSELTAETMNSALTEVGVDVTSDPYTWKYYMNLSGLYHSTDVEMTVVSMDTLETIPFTKESFLIHRATKSAYAYGSRYYNDLVTRYPEQEMLIFGILYPIDIETAINAYDGEILYYDTSLVEEQEITLIEEIQDWITTYMIRWHVPGYSITSEYYPATFLGIMFAHMPMMVMNARLARCKTDEVHSYHIREYLAGHNRLDVFMPYLNLKQQLFLYRNIKYINRNAGTTDTFNLLLERIVNERRMPLARYDIMQLTAEDQTTYLRPEVTMLREDINRFSNDGSLPNKTVAHALELQYPVARSNKYIAEEVERPTEELMETSLLGRVKSKTMESAILDTTDSVPFTREEVMLSHWAYLVGIGRFTSIINVTNPLTGSALQMSAKDAFIVYMFSINAAAGIRLETLPMFQVNRVQRVIIPSVDVLQTKWQYHNISSEFIAEARSRQPALGSYLSIAAFREFVEEEYSIQNQQRDWWVDDNNLQGRSDKEAFLSSFYVDTLVDLNSGMSYKEWFELKGYDFYDLGELDQDLIYRSIVLAVGGDSAGTASTLATLQEETFKLMARLSSYSVHYVTTINNTAFRILDTRYVRHDKLDSRYISHHFNDHGGVVPLTVKGVGIQQDAESIDYRQHPKVQDIQYGVSESSYDVSTRIDVTADSHGEYKYLAQIGRIKLQIDDDLTTPPAEYVID